MDNSTDVRTVPIIRHMSTNENLLGLGSLWDAEVANIEWDERREGEREHRATRYFRDALLELASESGVTVHIASASSAVHVQRIGMLWADGVLCGSNDRAIVPFREICVATNAPHCQCETRPPRVFDLVPMGAVLRELERKSALITLGLARHGLRGKICGVWRDAVSVRTTRGRVVVPFARLGLIVVSNGS